MNPTDSSEEAAFFANWLLPLRQANLRRGVGYLERKGGDDSYWGPVVSRSGGLQSLAADSSDASALLEALDRYWSQTNEQSLRRLTPELRKLLRGQPSRPPDGRDEAVVAEFVYPLY